MEKKEQMGTEDTAGAHSLKLELNAVLVHFHVGCREVSHSVWCVTTNKEQSRRGRAWARKSGTQSPNYELLGDQDRPPYQHDRPEKTVFA
jgi:hypothetical protein